MLIVTTPNDLDSSLKIDEVTINDLTIPNESIRETFNLASYVIYTDGVNVKALKNKFGDEPVQNWIKQTAIEYFKEELYRF